EGLEKPCSCCLPARQPPHIALTAGEDPSLIDRPAAADAALGFARTWVRTAIGPAAAPAGTRRRTAVDVVAVLQDATKREAGAGLGGHAPRALAVHAIDYADHARPSASAVHTGM